MTFDFPLPAWQRTYEKLLPILVCSNDTKLLYFELSSIFSRHLAWMPFIPLEFLKVAGQRRAEKVNLTVF